MNIHVRIHMYTLDPKDTYTAARQPPSPRITKLAHLAADVDEAVWLATMRAICAVVSAFLACWSSCSTNSSILRQNACESLALVNAVPERGERDRSPLSILKAALEFVLHRHAYIYACAKGNVESFNHPMKCM